MRTKILSIFVGLLLVSTTTLVNAQNTDSITLSKQYQKSISEAMSPDSSKICYDLVPVNLQNQNLVWKTINGERYVLTVTWKQNVSYYKKYLDSAFYNTGSYPIWITTVPELATRMKNEKATNIDLRLKQLLGLPPVSVYSYFVEFWVKPEDLFRPCPDKEITDKVCGLCFPDNTDTSHVAWINGNRITRYYNCGVYNNYPWTQLGYTYDWNPGNPSHVGLSEFVIGNNKKIVVKAIYTTQEYLQKNDYK